jgi:hypothetical protein
MNGLPQESERENEIRVFARCKTCHHVDRSHKEFRYFDEIVWDGLVDTFSLEFEDKSERTCYRWERRGVRGEGMKDIAREIVPKISPFDEAFGIDLQNKPELYSCFRVEKEMAETQLNGRTVEFGFNSTVAGPVEGIGTFAVTKHSDRKVTISIFVKSAVGGLNPKDAQYFLSQKQADAIKQNPTGSISDFSCYVP